jgi:hypothetical protein
MTLRLEELQLLPPGTYQKLIQRNFRPVAAQKQMGLAPVQERAERWLPQRYERLALEAYSQELLSEGELASYLHCDRIVARELYLARQVEAAEGGELVLDLGEDVLEVQTAR